MKHTKGPWRVYQEKPHYYSIGTDYADDRGHDQNIVRDVRRESNARLMAASPQLLKAVKALLTAYEQLMPGLAHIAVKDYANINQAPILARQAIEAAEPQPKPHSRSNRLVDICADAEWQGGE
jgi:hypothetical protein